MEKGGKVGKMVVVQNITQSKTSSPLLAFSCPPSPSPFFSAELALPQNVKPDQTVLNAAPPKTERKIREEKEKVYQRQPDRSIDRPNNTPTVSFTKLLYCRLPNSKPTLQRS